VTAFLFIGLGAERPWVTPDVLEADPVRHLISLASELTGVDIQRLLERGGRELDRTEIQQPAMIAVCCGLTRMLELEGVRPTVVLGHSLGELSAWAASGAIRAEDAVRIAVLRGQLMVREASRHPGAMLRLKGDRDVCERALAQGRTVGQVWIAAHNGPDEWALSGDHAAIDSIIPGFPVVRLPVTGPWHCPAMAGALDELTAALVATERSPMHARMITNRRGELACDQDLPVLLAGGLVHPVEWVRCLETLADSGARRLIAVGPGKSLRALVHRNLGVTRNVEMIDSMQAIHAMA
jgi:[acyl-carrier-protein] S-malonyltransferase